MDQKQTRESSSSSHYHSQSKLLDNKGLKKAPSYIKPKHQDQELDLRQVQGLCAEEVRKRQMDEGFNEIGHEKPKNVCQIALGVLSEPMFLLLLACAIIYFFLGDMLEALLLLGFVVIIIFITIYQERKTERALDALRNLSAPRALVVRDGESVRIPGREVVRGDICVLAEGDRIPADGILLWSLSLSVNESLLTGEAVPVFKTAAPDEQKIGKPGGDHTPYVFSGSMVVGGKGVFEVHSIGEHTSLGQIGKSLSDVKEENSPLQVETRKLVVQMFIIGAIVCVLVFVVYGLTMKDWVEGLLVGIALAMGLLPEEFPVVLAVFLAMGAWRLSQHQVLSRRNVAIETLGACSILCVDKTGTLTMNKMSVSMFCTDASKLVRASPEQAEMLPEECHSIVEYSILASQLDPFDPMEQALLQMGDERFLEKEHLHKEWKLVKEYPLTRELMSISRVYSKVEDDDDFVIAAKGAHEAIADLCHLPEDELTEMRKQVQQMASHGLRVLGVAKAHFRTGMKQELEQHIAQDRNFPSTQHDYRFEWVGLVGFWDPVRPKVKESVEAAYSAGLRVCDYPGTASHIASQIGLSKGDQVLTGPEIEAMTFEQLQDAVHNVNIYARVVPEQKLLLVKAFKALGKIVGMTGDGVNDAPALKAAHIGIAMGKRGTDVAREAADIVLLDDDFTSIVNGIKLGRRIFDNLRKAMAYIISIHVPMAGMVMLPVLFGWDIILHPMHIVFLELVIDPSCSVVLEAEEADPGVMNRPPRNLSKHMVSVRILLVSIAQGLVILASALTAYCYAHEIEGRPNEEANSVAFVVLMVANICLVHIDRSWVQWGFQKLCVRNTALIVVAFIGVACLGIVIYIPGVNSAFKFSSLSAGYLLTAACLGFLSVFWFELYKLYHYWSNDCQGIAQAEQPHEVELEEKQQAVVVEIH